jgi:hypothetical protein
VSKFEETACEPDDREKTSLDRARCRAGSEMILLRTARSDQVKGMDDRITEVNRLGDRLVADGAWEP